MPVTVEKLLSVLRSPHEKKLLQVELAATIGAGMPFVKATYNLEGDGPLVLSYDTTSALNMAAKHTTPIWMALQGRIQTFLRGLELIIARKAHTKILRPRSL